MKYNIYFRSDKRWEGRVSRGKDGKGKRIFRYFFGRTREEVEKKIDDYRAAENARCSVTVGILFGEWFRSVKFRVKESTAANYAMKAEKHILPAFGKSRTDSISETDIYEFIESKQKAGLSNRYISDIIVMMKSVFRYAERKYGVCNPADGISMPKSGKTEIKLLDEEQQKKLQRYIAEKQDNTTLGVALAISTGIRIGELCALQWQDIDIEKRILTVSKTIQRISTGDGKSRTRVIITEPKNESSKRAIPIPECIIPMLRKFRKTGENYLISGTRKPTEPRTMQYRFTSILRKLELPDVHFHSLRHLFASNAVHLGFDIKSLSEILGHSSVKITLNRYVHSDFERKRRYMELISISL